MKELTKVLQPHGGALNSGGTPGNAGGTGRPASVIRERCRGSFDQRIAVLEDIADGRPMQRIELPLGAVLRHVTCPKCGTTPKPETDDMLVLVSIEGRVSASPKDRRGAIDILGKYGLGTVKEITVEDVRGRLAETLSIIRAKLPRAQAEPLIAEMRPVWMAA